jgi:hypothetical protein
MTGKRQPKAELEDRVSVLQTAMLASIEIHHPFEK